MTGYFQTVPNLYVVPGFIASDAQGITTTLGRGGSDYTAAIWHSAIKATELKRTDVSGMMTADPPGYQCAGYSDILTGKQWNYHISELK
jgi:aspartokinase/homoserine dehydrogenase 1